MSDVQPQGALVQADHLSKWYGQVIGLNDVTVTQASAVWELRALDPTASPRRLFAGAMRIGRDHIASTVYTIVFKDVCLPALFFDSSLHIDRQSRS